MNWYQDSRPFLGQDPFVYRYKDKLLLIESVEEKRIAISTLDSLQSTQRKDTVCVWDHPKEHQVWAPELHEINGLYYIFYAASDGDNATHRNYVLEAVEPWGPYLYVGTTGPDIWGIDLTTFMHNGLRYAVWSGWEALGRDFPQNLYIARMMTPTELSPRMILAQPHLDWEKSHKPILEGPQAFHSKRGNLFILYSGNASWTTDYATGMLVLIGNNPLNCDHWERLEQPLMTNAGHGMVIEDTFIYHRKMSTMPGWHDREIATKNLEGMW